MKKYEQVMAWIEEKIKKDTLKNGDRLPGELAMAKELNVSRQTVRQAVANLEQKGVLSSIQGSGIYVGKREGISRRNREKYTRAAIISTYLDDYIFPGTVRGMQNTLSEAGCQVNLFITNNKVQEERNILAGILEKDDIDAILAEPVKSALPNPNLELYRELESRGTRIVFFNSSYPELDMPCVRIDDSACARDAVRMFVKLGHRKITGIFKSDDGQGHRRYQGYVQALLEANLEIKEERVIWLDSAACRRVDEMKASVLNRIGDSTALLCYNDEIAYAVTEECLQRGINIPQELSIASIDNSYLAKICRVPLTSYTHPKEELGKEAARMLLDIIDSGAKGEDLIMKAEVEIRTSVAPV